MPENRAKNGILPNRIEERKTGKRFSSSKGALKPAGRTEFRLEKIDSRNDWIEEQWATSECVC